jgi:hypothetical protein
MAKKRLSRDQKRKAKLRERGKNPHHQSPWRGSPEDQYKTPEWSSVFASTETGIIQADAITRQKMTDAQVRQALETMIQGLREGSLEPGAPEDDPVYRPGEEPALVVQMIQGNWQNLFQTFPFPGNVHLAGILRTLLGSIKTFTTSAPNSRGYLSYVTGFLLKMGISAQVQGPEGESIDLPEDPFVSVGEAWVLDGDALAQKEFLRQADELIAAGQGERVAEVAQLLLGQAGGGPHSLELMQLSVKAQKAGKP